MKDFKDRIKQLEDLREKVAALTYRELFEGIICEKLENKLQDLVVEARKIK